MAQDKEIPWCIIFLCGTAILCHICVLVGNLACSQAIGNIGSSVKGWSNVGLGVAESLHEELDELLSNVTLQLTDAINRTMQTQEMIDNMLALMGGTAVSSGAQALHKIALVQSEGELVGNPIEQVMDVVVAALGNLPTFQQGLTALQDMLVNLKPALEQVGIWVETFADKVQATVEVFGTTMDRVQKIFDKMMMKMSADAGQNADVMQHETFNLFDTDSDGVISAQDLQTCADLYAINAIKGEKATELIEKYDQDGSGDLAYAGGNTSEFGLMVEDPSIIGIMATLLRAYAKRMSMVAGNVGAARMRDEVASSVVSYFQLVCSRNLTKVGWVSDMLTNATLPMPFTADVMAELALQKDDPNVLTVVDVGEIVVGMMMTLNADYTTQAFDLMSSAEHWSSEGFQEEDQPEVIRTVTAWMQSGPAAVDELQKHMVALNKQQHQHGNIEQATEEPQHAHHEHGTHQHQDSASLLEVDDSLTASEQLMLDVMDIMPHVAQQLAHERMEQYRLQKIRNRAQKRLKLFDTEAKRFLLDQLMHGQAASDGGAADLAERALSRGVPAKPETLLFAQWLKNNATSTADLLQTESMNYTGESSSPLDAFNTQVQGMVKKLSQFIGMMKRYASPSGIEHIEDMIDEFASMGMHDIFTIVGAKIVDVIMEAAGAPHAGHHPHGSNQSAHGSKSSAGANVSALQIVARRLEDGLYRHELHAAAESLEASASSNRLLLAPRKGEVMLLSERLQRANVHLDSWRRKRAGALNLNEAQFDQPAGGQPDLSGVWEQVGNFLREMEKVLPTSIELLKFARKEVSAVAANLDSIFGMLGNKGKGIFTKVADNYATIWTAYFVFVFLLTFSILIYGFWASGWLGGPQPIPKTLDTYEPPKTFMDRVACCCSACCRCCTNFHDTQSCFWSFILLFQVIVLLLFIVSIVFCILAAVQMFMGSSCVQLYIINDTKVCTQSLDQFATFLSSFNVGGGEVPLSMACQHHELLTCDLIHDKMLQAGVMTVAGSFVSVALSFELIFGIAIIHERARWRRIINEIEQDKAEEAMEK